MRNQKRKDMKFTQRRKKTEILNVSLRVEKK